MLTRILISIFLTCSIPLSLFASGDTVHVWMTASTDSSITSGLAPRADAVFRPDTTSVAAMTVIGVDADTQYQTWEGAGASFTDGAAWLVNRVLSPALRDSVMTALFDTVKGIGASFLRNPMGSSDLTRERYTYDGDSTDINDTTLPHFSVSHDTMDVLPLTKWARRLNPGLTLMMNAWSPPAWMKTNNSVVVGGVRPECFPHLARYYVRTIQAYESLGVHIDYVSLNNEPTCCPGLDYPSVEDITAADMQTMLRNNWLPQFAEKDLITKILLLDFNWYDIVAVEPFLTDTLITRSPHVGGVAFHGYFGDPATQTRVHDQYGLNVYITERSSQATLSTRAQQQQNFVDMVYMTRNWARSYVKWPVATDENWGPHIGGCSTCMGMVRVHASDAKAGQFDYLIDYYTIGHLSKFVRNGARRIFSTADSTVLNVAFVNTNGSIALVAYNNDSLAAHVFKVLWGSKSFTYGIPASASMTFFWDGPVLSARDKAVRTVAAGMPEVILRGNTLLVKQKVAGKISVELLTVQGRKCRVGENENGNVMMSLKGLSSGLYLLKIENRFGRCWKKIGVGSQ
ncbi:MAG TPA: glycoside hydrolase family 30 beta sandwich domain-containing protein [Chitinivibrionales bacterium]|nr:glycoside hydrolase family 30 beta sandwich domain-containing protein [Chitinivibrionales bacterium]